MWSPVCGLVLPLGCSMPNWDGLVAGAFRRSSARDWAEVAAGPWWPSRGTPRVQIGILDRGAGLAVVVRDFQVYRCSISTAPGLARFFLVHHGMDPAEADRLIGQMLMMLGIQ